MKSLAIWLLLTGPVWADDVVTCNPTHPEVPNAVVSVMRTVDGTPLLGQANRLVWQAPNNLMDQAEIDRVNALRASLDALATVPERYWKCSGAIVSEMSAAEKTALDAAAQATTTASVRTTAKSQADTFARDPVLLRAVILVLLDEINALRADIDAMSKESAQITDRTRPARTLSQAKTAILNKIDAGSAD